MSLPHYVLLLPRQKLGGASLVADATKLPERDSFRERRPRFSPPRWARHVSLQQPGVRLGRRRLAWLICWPTGRARHRRWRSRLSKRASRFSLCGPTGRAVRLSPDMLVLQPPGVKATRRANLEFGKLSHPGAVTQPATSRIPDANPAPKAPHAAAHASCQPRPPLVQATRLVDLRALVHVASNAEAFAEAMTFHMIRVAHCPIKPLPHLMRKRALSRQSLRTLYALEDFPLQRRGYPAWSTRLRRMIPRRPRRRQFALRGAPNVLNCEPPSP